PFLPRDGRGATVPLEGGGIPASAGRAAYRGGPGPRRKTVLSSIEEQGKLTLELRASIEAASTKQSLEDLYLPFKPKRRTRATIAREGGYEPLAAAIFAQPERLPDGLAVSDQSLAGARDIMAEWVSERA